MVIFKDNKFYPQNFFIASGIDEAEPTVCEIVSQAKSVSPASFTAQCDSFYYVFHYVPPYESITNEIKRLQDEIFIKKRFCDEYRGYIVIDISDWSESFEEENFHLLLDVLSAKADFWKYIFTAGKLGEQNKKALFTAFSSAFWVKELACMQKAVNFKSFAAGLSKAGMQVNPDVEEIFMNTVSKVCNTSKTIKVLHNDIRAYFCDKEAVDGNDVISYALDSDSFLFSLLDEKQKEDLLQRLKGKEEVISA